jgi:hypothetical protein
MQNTELELKRQAVISAIAQVMQEYAEEIDAYLRQESRYWFDEHPEVDVGDSDKTLEDIVTESKNIWSFCCSLEDALEEWLLDGENITERQYQIVTRDEDAREEILTDLISSFTARMKYQDLSTSSETE